MLLAIGLMLGSWMAIDGLRKADTKESSTGWLQVWIALSGMAYLLYNAVAFHRNLQGL